MRRFVPSAPFPPPKRNTVAADACRSIATTCYAQPRPDNVIQHRASAAAAAAHLPLSDTPPRFELVNRSRAIPLVARRRRAEVACKLEGLLRGEKPTQRCEGGRGGCARRVECRALSTPANHVQATALLCSSLLCPPCARFCGAGLGRKCLAETGKGPPRSGNQWVLQLRGWLEKRATT
jgi:hypothetical protein